MTQTKCIYCGERFASTSAFKAHLKQQHPDTLKQPPEAPEDGMMVDGADPEPTPEQAKTVSEVKTILEKF